MKSPGALAVVLLAAAALVDLASALAANRFVLGAASQRSSANGTVTFDHRAVVINGKRQLILAGSIHYPRSTPAMWPRLFQLAKESGLNAIDTYVFWNDHEPERDQFDFAGRKDLRQFVKLAGEYGLLVVLRIGPYVCAEWNYGGLPAWLREVPGIQFRTYNEPFMREMERFVGNIVRYTEDLFHHNGGPIALLQVENEYGLIERDYGADGHAYIEWAAEFAQRLETRLPWFLCVQDNVTGIVNTCNGFYCDKWMREDRAFPQQAGMWTENWSGWFSGWGDLKPTRPTEDLALGVALWFINGGTYNAYYMFHGGTNFARTAGGGPAITTTYDYDAPVGEFGHKSEPKFSHLQALHTILNQYSHLLLLDDKAVRNVVAPGIYAYTIGNYTNSDDSLLFLHTESLVDRVAPVEFMGSQFHLPRWSVTIAKGPAAAPTILYNTATINVDESALEYGAVSTANGDAIQYTVAHTSEPIGVWNSSAVIESATPLEQISITGDTTDYLWYVLRDGVRVSGTEVEVVLEDVNDFVAVFFDDQLVGHSRGGANVTIKFTIEDDAGTARRHKLQLATQTLGLTNFGSHRELWSRGILGRVWLNAAEITMSGWQHQAGLLGPASWQPAISGPRPWTWYRVSFPAVHEDSEFASYALDLGSMGKGQAWVNGQHIGRYWNISAALPTTPTNPYPNPDAPATAADMAALVDEDGRMKRCDYAGPYYQDKCRVGTIGEPTQRFYHVPADWLSVGAEGGENSVILFEELGGDVSKVKLVTVQSTTTTSASQSTSALVFQ